MPTLIEAKKRPHLRETARNRERAARRSTLAWKLAQRGLHIEVDSETEENLVLTNQHLRRGSLIILAFHSDALSTVIQTVGISALFPKAQVFGGPAAYDQMTGIKGPFTRGLAGFAGARAFTVVREKDIKLGIADEKMRHYFLKCLIAGTHQVLDFEGGIYGLDAGSTRRRKMSKDIKPAFVDLAVERPWVKFVNMAYAPDSPRSIRVSKPISLAEAKIMAGLSAEETLTDETRMVVAQTLRQDLANMLPEDMRGDYR